MESGKVDRTALEHTVTMVKFDGRFYSPQSRHLSLDLQSELVPHPKLICINIINIDILLFFHWDYKLTSLTRLTHRSLDQLCPGHSIMSFKTSGRRQDLR